MSDWLPVPSLVTSQAVLVLAFGFSRSTHSCAAVLLPMAPAILAFAHVDC